LRVGLIKTKRSTKPHERTREMFSDIFRDISWIVFAFCTQHTNRLVKKMKSGHYQTILAA
jgi:hypothetical protein